MEESGAQNSSRKMIIILGDRWWPQKAKEEGDKTSKQFPCNTWENVVSAQMWEVFQLGVGTVLCLERDVWSMVK